MTVTTPVSAGQPVWKTGRFKASAAMMGSAACWDSRPSCRATSCPA